MTKPKLAICSFSKDPKKMMAFAVDHDLSGIDWSFDLESVPDGLREERDWVRSMSVFSPLEVRFHCPFYKMDLGADDMEEAMRAEGVFQKFIRLVSRLNGKFLSIHIGLGHDSTEPLSWDRTIDNLRRLVSYGAGHGVTVCLENLAWGWTSKPHLFEKLIRGSNAGVTFDIGHAYVSEAIRSQYYTVEDFVTPHAHRVYNAHVYHEEIPGEGHFPPRCLDDIETRLDLLTRIGCSWWVLEVHNKAGILQTKKVVDEYLTGLREYGTSPVTGARMAS